MVLMIGIYAIRNTKNNKMYIGESIDIEQRWKVHKDNISHCRLFIIRHTAI